MDEASLPLPRLIRKSQVCEMTGLSSAGIINRVRKGLFPRPVQLDALQVAWPESEVLAWIQARIDERNAGQLPPGAAELQEARHRGGRTRAADMTAGKGL